MPPLQKIHAAESRTDAGYEAEAHFEPRARAPSLQRIRMQYTYGE